jgi:hypothetical protein
MNTNEQEADEQVSVKQVFAAIRKGFNYVKSKWKLIVFFAFVGAIAGFIYSIEKKTVYTASCTFVIDDGNKKGALSELAGIASLSGLGQNSVGGVFQADNILELYKSRSMIEKALLSEVVIEGKKQLLIERYIAFNELREKWKDKHIDKLVFNGDPEQFSRTQDSIITDITGKFNKNSLIVEKPDKKTGIIKVEFESKDEIFAKEFISKLVETVGDFYIQTTTKKSAQNVRILQHQADSVRAVLNYSIGGVASSIDAAPNANPLLLSLKVPSQRKEIDVQAGTLVYGEIVKNLEIDKITLRQEMPLIQVIDKPVLPLLNDKVSKTKGIIIGILLSVFFVLVALVCSKVYTMLL